MNLKSKEDFPCSIIFVAIEYGSVHKTWHHLFLAKIMVHSNLLGSPSYYNFTGPVTGSLNKKTTIQ